MSKQRKSSKSCQIRIWGGLCSQNPVEMSYRVMSCGVWERPLVSILKVRRPFPQRGVREFCMKDTDICIKDTDICGKDTQTDSVFNYLHPVYEI